MELFTLGHTLLANSLEAPATSGWGRYFLPGVIGYLLLGLLFALIGIFIGWLLWRHCRARVAEIKQENEKLLSEFETEERRVKTLETQVASLEKA